MLNGSFERWRREEEEEVGGGGVQLGCSFGIYTDMWDLEGDDGKCMGGWVGR